MTSEVLGVLCSSKKIERDRGILLLHTFLSSANEESRIVLEEQIINILNSSEDIPWETKHGCLLGAKEVILRANLDCERELNFLCQSRELARKLLTDMEVRVRLESGKELIKLGQSYSA